MESEYVASSFGSSILFLWGQVVSFLLVFSSLCFVGGLFFWCFLVVCSHSGLFLV